MHWHRSFQPLIFFSVIGVLFGSAEAAEPKSQAAVAGQRGVATARAVVNFEELARREAKAPPPVRPPRVIPFMPGPGDRPMPPGVTVPVPRPPQIQPQPLVPAAGEPSLAPVSSFEALGDNNTRIPPDTQGAAGPNHLMVALNTEVRAQNRLGGELGILVSLDFFWQATGAVSPFDPKLIYDPFASRWIFAAVSDRRSADSSVLIGVSETKDPTGFWNLFRVDADGTDTNWADFPSLGFNKNWIAVQVNMFSISDDSFVEGKIFVFDKDDLFAAGPGNFTAFTDPNAFTQAPAVTYDSTLNILYLAEHWTGNSGGQGFLRLSTVTGSIGSEVYTAGTAFVATSTTWASAPPGFADFAPQRDTTEKIQNNDSRLWGLVFRNGSLWATQNAFLPTNSPDHTAAQWWQFLPDGTLQQFGRIEDPSGAIFYAFPSLAVNSRNDMLLGCSCFSATRFASACYALRFSSDPVNTTRAVVPLKAGEDVYVKRFGGPDNRWGDYSHTVVDPINDLDFWTIQEYASSPVFPNGNDRWGTWWGKVEPDQVLSFSNANTITINDASAATPYPSNITVSGVSQTVARVVVRLNGLSHTFPDDLDILLAGPTGETAIVLSDVGGSGGGSGLDLILDDAGPTALPDSEPLLPGIFQPTNIDTGDTFPGPAPAPSGNTVLSVFSGLDPNGTWSLFVVDDEGFDVGEISGGWTLQFILSSPKKRRGQLISE